MESSNLSKSSELSRSIQTLQKEFLNETELMKYNFYEKFKNIFFTITLIAPIRFFLTMLFSGLGLLFLYLGFIGYDGNISFLRRLFLYIPQFFARLVLFILGYYYINEQYEYEPNKFTNIRGFYFPSYLERKDKAKIIIANHVTFLDSVFFVSRGYYNVVAKADLINYPVIGRIIRGFNPILVPFTPEEKQKLPDVNSQINKVIMNNKNKSILIFPEGCTKQAKYLIKFRLGAFRPLQPIQPIILNYNYKHMDPSWTHGTKELKLIYRLCCQFINHLNIKYFSVITNDININTNPENYRDIIYQKMLNNSNLLKSSLSNFDKKIDNTN